MISDKKHNNKKIKRNDESGVALLMTVFVVALSTILVLDFSSETLRYQRQCRMFQERVQADFMLRTGIAYAKAIIELPKEDPTTTTDSHSDPWSIVDSLSDLPIEGFTGETRLKIVDDSAKININDILSVNQNFWREILRNLFVPLGFVNEKYPEEEARTLGNTGYEAGRQIAVLIDWIDSDQQTFVDPQFDFQGIESNLDQRFFFNRPLASLSELALVPGITLEKLNRMSRYIKTNGISRININTTSQETLEAMGIDPIQIDDIIDQRELTGGIAQGTLDQIVSLEIQTGANPQLGQFISTTSQGFSVFLKITMPNVTRWARARFSVRGGINTRTATKEYLEIL